ncbi:unnamed protein product [Rodentolepis nana]|uniref:non-specific serine/threonine protein kinase n=1 Tax=Rodentolepis nana TaxID=102285 RepID=A0A158QIK3_RODNA|nr:unnamed protein product [Rodentolepis nana]
MSASVNFKKSPSLHYRQSGQPNYASSSDSHHPPKPPSQPPASFLRHPEDVLSAPPPQQPSTGSQWLAIAPASPFPPHQGASSPMFHHPNTHSTFQLHPECYGQMPPAVNLSHAAAFMCNYSPVDPAARFYVNGSLTQTIEAYQQPRTPQSGPRAGYSFQTHEMGLHPPDHSAMKRPNDLDYLRPRKGSLPTSQQQQISPGKSGKMLFPIRPPTLVSTGSPPPLPPRQPRQQQISQQQQTSQQTRPPALPPPPSGSGQRVQKQTDPWSNWGGASVAMTTAANGGGVLHSVSFISSPTPGKAQRFPIHPSVNRPSTLLPSGDEAPQSHCLKPPSSNAIRETTPIRINRHKTKSPSPCLPSGSGNHSKASTPNRQRQFQSVERQISPSDEIFRQNMHRLSTAVTASKSPGSVEPPPLSTAEPHRGCHPPDPVSSGSQEEPGQVKAFTAGLSTSLTSLSHSSSLSDFDTEGSITSASSSSSSSVIHDSHHHCDSSSSHSSSSSFCYGCAHSGANATSAPAAKSDVAVTNIAPQATAISVTTDSDYVPFVKAVNPAVYRRFIEQKYFSNVGRVHKEREERQARLEAEMALMGLSEASRAHMRKMLQAKESNYMRMQRARMDESMFIRLKRLGVGAFGWVWLVRKKENRQLYAMKILKKRDVVRRRQLAHVQAERDILAEADSDWVVKLFFSFQDSHALYLVMEYIPGKPPVFIVLRLVAPFYDRIDDTSGDMMSLLIKKEIFEEPLARFYIAELTLALESVHELGFIHR